MMVKDRVGAKNLMEATVLHKCGAALTLGTSTLRRQSRTIFSRTCGDKKTNPPISPKTVSASRPGPPTAASERDAADQLHAFVVHIEAATRHSSRTVVLELNPLSSGEATSKTCD